jgi:hypothetical protein
VNGLLARLGVAGLLIVGAADSAGAADLPSGPIKFDCDVALLISQQRFSAPTPVTVSFVIEGKVLRDVHVVDKGGILYPGGNMKVVKNADAISLQAVEIPAERPGVWSGRIDKEMYRLSLSADGNAAAAVIGLGLKPIKNTGRFGLVWNASHQAEGMPEPLSGSGGGNCTIAQTKDGTQ